MLQMKSPVILEAPTERQVLHTAGFLLCPGSADRPAALGATPRCSFSSADRVASSRLLQTDFNHSRSRPRSGNTSGQVYQLDI